MYGAPILNRLPGRDFQWQHLPVPFTVYADGIDLVVFEEFGSEAGRRVRRFAPHDQP